MERSEWKINLLSWFERSLERYVKAIPFVRHVSSEVVNVGDLVDVIVPTDDPVDLLSSRIDFYPICYPLSSGAARVGSFREKIQEEKKSKVSSDHPRFRQEPSSLRYVMANSRANARKVEEGDG
uniref:Uncharacterized protein n=1 Tax=Solanum tuberosum TaxID=4113 RepID=M1DCN1_SOLTU